MAFIKEFKRESFGKCMALDALESCCNKTISDHSQNNKMLVCNHCKRLLKLYLDDVSYRNYLKYCLSRGRKVETVETEQFYIIVQPSQKVD